MKCTKKKKKKYLFMISTVSFFFCCETCVKHEIGGSGDRNNLPSNNWITEHCGQGD